MEYLANPTFDTGFRRTGVFVGFTDGFGLMPAFGAALGSEVPAGSSVTSGLLAATGSVVTTAPASLPGPFVSSAISSCMDCGDLDCAAGTQASMPINTMARAAATQKDLVPLCFPVGSIFQIPPVVCFCLVHFGTC